MIGGRVGSGRGRGDVPLLFEGGSVAALGDGELLGRFLARRDEGAFEALVARLGPTVLGVCRRMLADPHDVDDAFQGTFLVLVRRAGSIRDRDRVATWTYEVAVRVARRARLDAARRTARERSLVPAEPGETAPSIDRSELRAQIDEEIARLPEHHRRAVLLCDVEGLSREEAAARLGWTPNMVRGRLDRARARLRERLSRRGLAPSDSWMTLVAHLPTPRVALVAATVRAALGRGPGAALATGSALALSQGVGTMMILHDWKSLAALVLSAGSATLVAATAGPGPQAAQSPPPAGPARPAEAKPRRPLIDIRDAPTSGPFISRRPYQDPNAPRPSMEGAPESVRVRVSGRVLDLKGRPVAAATVRVIGTRMVDGPERLEVTTAVAGTATTAADGRYRLASVSLPTSRLRRLPQCLTPYAQCQVVAWAPGFGFGWHRVQAVQAVPLPDPDDLQGHLPFNSPFEMDVHLRPEAELKGRVVDEAGRPVAGVKVVNHSIDLLDEQGGETTVWLDPSQSGLLDRFGQASTDGEGRFRMPGLPAETCSWLSFERPGSTLWSWLYASTSATGAGVVHPEPSFANHNGRGRHEVHPAEMTVTMATTGRVDVRVSAEDDGRPLPGIDVESMNQNRGTGIASGGRTDAEGRVAIDLPPGEYPGLSAAPTSPTSRFVRTYHRPLVVAPVPVARLLELRMRAGAEVFIEVVDAETGRGIPGVRFEVKPEGRPGEWAKLQRSRVNAMIDGEPADADGKLRSLLDPDPKGPRRVRVAGLDGPENPDGPALPRPTVRVGGPTRPAIYEAVEALSEPFEPAPGQPTRLRFVLRKK